MWGRLLKRDWVDRQIPAGKIGHGTQDQGQGNHGIKRRDHARDTPHGVLPDIRDREGLTKVQGTYQVSA